MGGVNHNRWGLEVGRERSVMVHCDWQREVLESQAREEHISHYRQNTSANAGVHWPESDEEINRREYFFLTLTCKPSGLGEAHSNSLEKWPDKF